MGRFSDLDCGQSSAINLNTLLLNMCYICHFTHNCPKLLVASGLTACGRRSMGFSETAAVPWGRAVEIVDEARGQWLAVAGNQEYALSTAIDWYVFSLDPSSKGMEIRRTLRP